MAQKGQPEEYGDPDISQEELSLLNNLDLKPSPLHYEDCINDDHCPDRAGEREASILVDNRSELTLRETVLAPRAGTAVCMRPEECWLEPGQDALVSLIHEASHHNFGCTVVYEVMHTGQDTVYLYVDFSWETTQDSPVVRQGFLWDWTDQSFNVQNLSTEISLGQCKLQCSVTDVESTLIGASVFVTLENNK